MCSVVNHHILVVVYLCLTAAKVAEVKGCRCRAYVLELVSSMGRVFLLALQPLVLVLRIFVPDQLVAPRALTYTAVQRQIHLGAFAVGLHVSSFDRFQIP